MQKRVFEWRGFMLDSVRHFFPPAEVRRLILGAKVCGMNRMHWHLTDDQGWRIEIRQYPQLTEKGSVRGRSFFGGVNETENNSGYYTQEEIREVVRFAGENGMEVIPEIEIPGHAGALLAACPEYGCRRMGKEPWQYAVEVSGGIFPNLVCAGKESTVCFLKNVLDEVTELFPCRMVHIGGDEAIKLHWRRCPDCRRKMQELGLDSEDALQRELVLQIGAYLAGKGRETIVWNDVLAGGMLPGHFIVQQWMGGEEKTRQFMEQGGRVICSDSRVYYFDYPYGQTDLRKIWEFPRIPPWAEGQEDRLLGIECPLWTERVTNTERAAFLLFPRLAAAGLKAQDGEGSSFENFMEKIRDMQGKILGQDLTCAPEEMWDMPEETARADRKADHDRMYAPEAMPYIRKVEKLVMLEKTERLMKEIGVPEEFALRAGDQALADIYSTEKEKDDDGAEAMIRQLMQAAESRAWGVWKDIPEKIWLDTMRCYSRFISEFRRSYGRNGFDRAAWTVRQAGCRLFRIGEMEYELFETGGERAIALHIPSDASLEAGRLNDSVRKAGEFLQQYYPEWTDLPMICESWLLSPALEELLPPASRIRHFRDAFDLFGDDPEDTNALEWVFHIAEGQRAGMKYETLPEDTSLQRGMKAMLLAGRKPGSGRGVLLRKFRD